MNWNLKSGVLIIGSLLWQDYLDEKDDNIRHNWRLARLDMDNKIPIKVPIRYGRISRYGTPTMIFSNKMKSKLGFAYLVPFKSVINNDAQLTLETNSLSAAEGMKGNFVTNWGVLTYLLNEQKIDKAIKSEIISLFKKRKNQAFKPEEYKSGKEKACITSSLKLDINWIESLDPSDQKKINQFDFLLATATKPENKVVTLQQIAAGIKADNDRKYFLNNLSHGIVTQEDFEISKLII